MKLVPRTTAAVAATFILALAAASAAAAAPTPPAPASSPAATPTTSTAASFAPQTLYDGYYVTNDLNHPLFLIQDSKWTATANGWGDAPPARLDPGQTYYFSVQNWLGYNDDSAATWSDDGTTSGTWYSVRARGTRLFDDTQSTMLSLDPNARLITNLGPAYGQTKFYIEPKAAS